MINMTKILKLTPPLLIICLFSSLILIQSAQADMESTSYRIIFDSVNVGGLDYGLSETYGLRDSIGQEDSGLSTSTNYQTLAGYRQAYEDSFITVSGGGNLSLGNLSGPGATAQGDRFWKVTTNYNNYSLSIRGNTSPVLQRIGGGASFLDYSPDNLDPDYEFILPSSESVFAFSPDGPDVVSNYLHDNIVCNSGSNSSLDNCWDGLSTSNKLISYGDSNYPTGATTTINFKAGIGFSAVLSAGDYQGAVLVTILPL